MELNHYKPKYAEIILDWPAEQGSNLHVSIYLSLESQSRGISAGIKY